MPETTIDALVDGGKANAGPPLGPALGPIGINIGEVVAAINEKTKDFVGMQVPVKVIIDSSTKKFRIEVGSPPTSALIKKELGIEKGSGKQKLAKAGDLPIQAAVKVARMKRDNMLAADLKAATKEVIGTCISLGIVVEGKDPRDACKDIDEGAHDALFKDGADLSYDEAAARSKAKDMSSQVAAASAKDDAGKKDKAEEEAPAEAPKEEAKPAAKGAKPAAKDAKAKKK